jgi:DNA invertase Pin-like site-specific DNA recombinase
MSKHLGLSSAKNSAVRAVIYARYSSEKQRQASIEDQIRTCKARIEADGWDLVATYTDHAQSGASHLRPGYQKLLADGRGGIFDVVVAEALDGCRGIRSTSLPCSSNSTLPARRS